MTPSLLRLAIAASLLSPAAALAQNTIPNGLSGPGGTMTFSPAPSVPNLSNPDNVAVPSASNLGAPSVSSGGRTPTRAPRIHRHRR